MPRDEDAEPPETLTFSEHLACTHCGLSFDELAPRNFSFNSPYGACPTCDGLVLRRRVAVVLRRKHAGTLLLLSQGPQEERQPDFSNTLTEFVDLDSPWDEPKRRATRMD